MAQEAAATTTSNPLNNFIGAAGAVASQIKSANAKQTSSSSSTTSSPSPTAPAQTSAAAAPHDTGLSKGALIGIIVGCIVAALLILALISICCCLCLRRRRRRSKRHSTVTPVKDEEIEGWKRPINPGRHYSNYSPAQHGQVPMEHHPTVPLMAAAAVDHERHHNKAPSLSQHPAMRQQPENPFVPVPPSPRKTAPNSRPGLTDGMVPGDSPYLMDEKQPLRDRSRSSSLPRSNGDGLPTTNVKNPNRPPTPMGLAAFGAPATAGAIVAHHHDEKHHPNDLARTSSPPQHLIGQPYDDMHVHVLQTDAPSRELRHSPNAREAPFPSTTYTDSGHHIYRSSRGGYSTPPEVPSRSPNRRPRDSMLADSSYDSSLSTTTDSTSSGERYQRVAHDPYQPAQRESVQPWEQHTRFSDSTGSGGTPRAPPIPWEESEYNPHAARRQSHSPRQSGDRRRNSRSPATSINGQPRRLRFEDLQSPMQQGQVGRGSGGYESVPLKGGHDSWDGGYEQHQRWSQGVGEAL
ncbi:hypothetical protein MMC21_001447 [Puttea exsequens]|nr:hypothetical protein [Puttea exsequens]